MSSLDQIKEIKKIKNRKGPVDKEKTISALKEASKVTKGNIKRELDMVLNKKTYKGSDGKVYGPDHYKKALSSDMEWQRQANKKLSNSKKISSLKAAKEKALSTKDKLPTTYKKTTLKKK